MAYAPVENLLSDLEMMKNIDWNEIMWSYKRFTSLNLRTPGRFNLRLFQQLYLIFWEDCWVFTD